MIIRRVGHPSSRMAERSINDADIQSVLHSHHTSLPGRKGGRCYIGSIGGRDLKVWLLSPLTGQETESSVVIMKSAAWRDDEDDD